VPYDETIGAFVELQRAGKIRHIGISNVTAGQLAFAQELCAVVSVENRYNAGDRNSDAVLDACREQGIAFLPWAPMLMSDERAGAAIAAIASERGATAQQVALQWLLRRAPNVIPIPGTSSIGHADENVDAAWLVLDDRDVERIDDVA
jgi:pyridoxine 4-dehydrogenase